jgi:hypothetical protein
MSGTVEDNALVIDHDGNGVPTPTLFVNDRSTTTDVTR